MLSHFFRWSPFASLLSASHLPNMCCCLQQLERNHLKACWDTWMIRKIDIPHLYWHSTKKTRDEFADSVASQWELYKASIMQQFASTSTLTFSTVRMLFLITPWTLTEFILFRRILFFIWLLVMNSYYTYLVPNCTP